MIYTQLLGNRNRPWPAGALLPATAAPDAAAAAAIPPFQDCFTMGRVVNILIAFSFGVALYLLAGYLPPAVAQASVRFGSVLWSVRAARGWRRLTAPPSSPVPQILMIVWVMTMRSLVMPQVTDEATKQAAERQHAAGVGGRGSQAGGAAAGGKQQAAQQKGRAGKKKQ